MTDEHVSARLIADYVSGDVAIPVGREWALEAHRESCATCRSRVADAVATRSPDVGALVGAVWTDVAAAIGPQARVRSPFARWLGTWAAPSLVPWLLMTVVVIGAALVMDVAVDRPLVLLLAPVTPLLGVAAAWTRGTDPMHELIAGTPRSGLRMVLRRTAAVLVVVIPLLALAGGITDVTPALWLVPSLAFTVGTLALGTVTGVTRAAVLLALVWGTAVIVPSLVTGRVPALLTPELVPVWGGVLVAGAVVVRWRATVFQRLN
ncbi:MAG TPA: zf-HC2 domain-containing protein [Pseudonocardiaceae bacterium]|nr:zf-HC2 domain-containing protein [Pseudonocardiaceae bacterium]